MVLYMYNIWATGESFLTDEQLSVTIYIYMQNLYHPLLPVRIHGKLIFSLCRTCCEQMIQEDYPHQDPNDRVLRRTWGSEEVKEAVKLRSKGSTLLGEYKERSDRRVSVASAHPIYIGMAF